MRLPEITGAPAPHQKSVASVCATWRAARLDTDTGESRRLVAQLRRADGPVEALMLEVTHDLHARLLREGHDLRSRPAVLAVIAIALAHLDDSTGTSLPARLAQRGVTEARFDGLMRCEAHEDLLRPLLRVIAQVGRKAHAGRLASDIYYWSDRVRTDWAFEFFGAERPGSTTQIPA